MNNQTPSDSDSEVALTIQEIVEYINSEETVVFCGAGISLNSGIPIAQTLIFDIIGKLGAWGSLRKKIMASDLPFESFMETLHERCNIDTLLDIFNQSEPNGYHFLLANLVKAHKLKTFIITVNFDKLIEAALERVGLIEGKDFDVIFNENDFEKIDWGQNRLKLLKLHGSMHDKKDLSITLSKVAGQQWSAPRQKVIDQIFCNGNHKNVLILGYSSSDIFDLVPQIEMISESNKNIIYVDHTNSSLNQKYHVQDIKEKRNKNPFKQFKGKRLFYHTTELANKIGLEILKYPFYEEEHKVSWSDKESKWKKILDNWYTESVTAKVSNTINSNNAAQIIQNNILGEIYYKISDYLAAKQHYKNVLDVTRNKDVIDKASEARALYDLGSVYCEQGEYLKAIESYFEPALNIVMGMQNEALKAIVFNSLGLAHQCLGRPNDALEYLKKALDITEKTEDYKLKETILGNIGLAYQGLNEYQKAIDFHELALKISIEIGDKKGESHHIGNLGCTYQGLNKYHRAINDYFEPALKIAKQIGDINEESVQFSNLGNAYYALGEYHKAIAHYDIAYRKLSYVFDVNSPKIIMFKDGFDNICSNIIHWYLDVLEKDPRSTEAFNTIAEMLVRMNRFDEALEKFRKVLEIDSRNTDAYNGIGNVWAILEKYNDSETHYLKTLEIDPNNLNAVIGMAKMYERKSIHGPDSGYDLNLNLSLLISANDLLRKALEIDPANEIVTWELNRIDERMLNLRAHLESLDHDLGIW